MLRYLSTVLVRGHPCVCKVDLADVWHALTDLYNGPHPELSILLVEEVLPLLVLAAFICPTPLVGLAGG